MDQDPPTPLQLKLHQIYHEFMQVPEGFSVLLACLFCSLATIVAGWLGLQCWFHQLAWQAIQVPLFLFLLVAFKLGRIRMTREDWMQGIMLLILALVAVDIAGAAFWLLEQEPSRPSIKEVLTQASVAKASSMLSAVQAEFLSACVAAPLVEELFFRGVVLRTVVRSGASVSAALAVQAAMFAFPHKDESLLAYYFLSGMILGVLSLTRWGLWPAIFAHALFNGVLLLHAWRSLP